MFFRCGLFRLGGFFIAIHRFFCSFIHCCPEIFCSCQACAQGGSFELGDGSRSQFRFLFRIKDWRKYLISFRSSAIASGFNLLLHTRGFVYGSNDNRRFCNDIMGNFTEGAQLNSEDSFFLGVRTSLVDDVHFLQWFPGERCATRIARMSVRITTWIGRCALTFFR